MNSLKVLSLCLVIFTHLALSLVCDHEIFCHGRILHEVQMNSLYPDSKTYVDMKLKLPKETILKNFEMLLLLTDDQPIRSDLTRFLKKHFDDVASEFEPWTPPDIKPDPKFLDEIRDARLKTFARKIHSMWAFLSRKIKEDVLINPDQYSMIYLPEPIIVPGGRFREVYYWDTFWICKGLLLSEMHITVKGLIKNYVHLVEKYGLIPNGNRIYYQKRSQPPMLIAMVDVYHEFTKDFAFVQEVFPALEKEFEFWRRNRSVTIRKSGKVYTMYRFFEGSYGPRPESYKEDVMEAGAFETAQGREEFFREIKAAAESGWDFTSRWYVFNSSETEEGTHLDTKTRSILPVDLNSVVEWNGRTMARFCKAMGRSDKARYYARISRDLRRAIAKVLWDEKTGAWLDYDLVNKKLRNRFYPSNLAPLWSQSYERRDTDYYTTRVLRYLDHVNILRYPGGIPTSKTENTGQQWDYPNTWAPLQDIVITGLYQTNNEEAMKLAVVLAQNWISTNYVAFEESKAMYEKYDATVMGMPGHGGEYENQIGFGWTNGVALDMMHRFGNKLVAPSVRRTLVHYGDKAEPVEPTTETAHADMEATHGGQHAQREFQELRTGHEHVYLPPDEEEESHGETERVDHRFYEQFYTQRHDIQDEFDQSEEADREERSESRVKTEHD